MADKPNLIDRAIEAVAPGWAVRRTIAREQLATHRGGINTRTGKAWGQSRSIRGGSSSDRFNQGSRRDRARKVYAEHPIGRSLLKTETDNVVSSGLRLQAKTASTAFNSEAEDRWDAWLDQADIRGMRCGVDLVRQCYSSPRRDGDGGIVLVDRGGESKLQYIPGDLICNPNGKYGDPGIIDGIEVDSSTRPVAFHVLDQNEEGKRDWSRVPASNFVYLAPEIDDDLGVRGDSCYSTIFTYLDQIDGYIDAVIIAARMAAVFGLIFKEEGASKQLAGLPVLQNSQGRDQKAITLENGMVRYVGPDGSVAQVTPQQPMQQTPDFIAAICRVMGLPFDMPLELVLKDMSRTSFSSARIGLIGYYRAARARQNAFKSRSLSRIYPWWLSREVKRGRFTNKAPDLFWDHKFLAEGWDYTDPVSEAQADQIQIDMGIKTPQMCAAERGRDWEEVQLELKAAKAYRRLAGLIDTASNMTRDRIELTLLSGARPFTIPSQTDQGTSNG